MALVYMRFFLYLCGEKSDKNILNTLEKSDKFVFKLKKNRTKQHKSI